VLSSNDDSLDVWVAIRKVMASMELKIGDNAPEFEAMVSSGESVKLSELISDGSGVILYFYPRDNTPGCTTQACDFRDNFGRLNGSGWSVLGVSTDDAKSHQRFIEKNELPFQLIVDENADLHELYGTWREKNMYGKTYMGTLRSTFVINSEGKLDWASYGVRAKGHVDELIDFLRE
tara:strand:- start:226 stop:756 length:531 start_codon:yes stop_codon:yes gene_type:complete